jgi:predicted transcriptional regulator
MAERRAKRTHMEIKSRILELLILNPKGIKQTNMMYKANLCHGQIKTYFPELVSLEYIYSDAHHVFRITEKGIKYFINLKVAEKILAMNLI